MPDDDSLLGQNEVDVRNEAIRERLRHTYRPGWETREKLAVLPPDDPLANQDLADAIDHLRRLHETQAINQDAEQRRQQSITRTLDEIQRLMDASRA